MNHLNDRLALIALSLTAGGLLGLIAACSSDSNPTPGGPVIVSTAGSGGKGGASGSSAGASGGSSRGGSSSGGDSSSDGGSNEAGEAGEGGAAGAKSGGSGGSGGSAGSGPLPATCPKSDVGFYNQPSASLKSPFDDVKRLGTHATLPALPGT
jgi:hypothetical protein